MLPFLCAGDGIAHCFVVDTVRWLWGTFVQAFLDRDGAVGSLMGFLTLGTGLGMGAWGLMAIAV